MATYENWNHSPLSHAQVSAALGRLLEQPPSNFDSRIYEDRAFQQQNAEDPTAVARMSVKRIEQLIPAIEQKGARVFIFELPYSEKIEEARSVKVTREIVHTEFPDESRWLHLDFTRSELRWADGVHLDERSAVIMARSFDRALSSFLMPR